MPTSLLFGRLPDVEAQVRTWWSRTLCYRFWGSEQKLWESDAINGEISSHLHLKWLKLHSLCTVVCLGADLFQLWRDEIKQVYTSQTRTVLGYEMLMHCNHCRPGYILRFKWLQNTSIADQDCSGYHFACHGIDPMVPLKKMPSLQAWTLSIPRLWKYVDHYPIGCAR